MNISKRPNGDLSAIISIEVQPSDYQPKVDEAIKNYRKKANIPGFRPGQVPTSLIKKKFGKEVLAEELNRLLGNELYNYLRENKIDVLGSPLPLTNDQQELEEGRNFQFDYEVGLSPEVNVQLPAAKVPFYMIKVDDAMVDNDVNDMRRRYGKFSNPEAADANSILYGDFAELNENGEVKEGGVTTTTTVSIESLKDEEEKQKFMGAQKEKEIVFNPRNAIKNDTEVAAMLRVGKDSEAMDSNYRFTVKTVNQIEKAEINQELFDKAFGEGSEVTDEESFRAKIREGIASYFERQSDKKLQKEVRTQLLAENNISLPDDFLKRMLKSQQEKQIDEHTFDHEYFHVAEDLKWNLIESKIATEAAIEVKFEDVMDAAKVMIVQQFAQYGVPAPEDQKLQEMARDYVMKDDNGERVQRSILSQRVFEHLKKTLKLNMIELPYDEFVAKLNEKTEHELEHHH